VSDHRGPVRLGFLDDTPQGVDRPLLERALRHARARTERTGRFSGELELHVVRADGLPRGTARAVEVAFAELADSDALAVLGPAIGDNALVTTPLANARRVPTINFAGSERARGEYMFHLQIGSHEEEPPLLVRQLVREGHREVALVFERATIGARYEAFFDEACRSGGLTIATHIGLDPQTDPTPAMQTVLRRAPTGLVYLGLGLELPRVSRALREGGFDGARVCNSCGMFGWVSPPHRDALEGWAYIDVFREDNVAFEEARIALGLGEEDGPAGVLYADLATLAVEGLAHAPTLTRDGVRAGLESVKALPAALGQPGTQLGFGTWDRGALKGPYLVPRRWSGGRSVAWTV